MSDERFEKLRDAIAKLKDKIEELLPPECAGQADRFVRRAILTYQQAWATTKPTDKAKIPNASMASLIGAVMESAECGLLMDGKAAQPLPRNRNTGTKDNPNWITEVKFTPTYIGLLQVAKRGGTVLDVYAETVCEHDTFRAYREGMTDHLEHERPGLNATRGNVIGAYAIIVLSVNPKRWRYELMSRAELDAIQQLSPSKNYGPWKSFPDEMRKKTVVRRALKLYCDDASLARAFDAIDAPYKEEREDRLESGDTVPPKDLDEVTEAITKDTEAADAKPSGDDEEFGAALQGDLAQEAAGKKPDGPPKVEDDVPF